MALTEARKASLMAYCRIDALEADEEDVLEGMYAAAVAYMEHAGVSEPPEGTPRRAMYDMCVNAMVLDSWDRRGASADTSAIADNLAFRRRLNQLKMTEGEER
jgi:uncharacterized phage protein (predicted DNA packaging)